MVQFQFQLRMLHSTRPLIIAVLALGIVKPVFAQSSTRPSMTSSSSATGTTGAPKSSSELPITQAQGAAILEELRRIEILLASRQPLDEGSGPASLPSAQTKIKIEPGAYALGREDAPVVLVEFTDLECPVCQRFHATAFGQLKRDYVDTGKVRFVSRDLPLPMHHFALDAAVAARCAGVQGKFWDFRDAILSRGIPPTPEELTAAGHKVGLDMDTFVRCQKSGQFAEDIQRDADEAARAGINGTPAFVIGRLENGLVEGRKWLGNRPYTSFQSAIEAALNSPETAKSRSR